MNLPPTIALPVQVLHLHVPPLAIVTTVAHVAASGVVPSREVPVTETATLPPGSFPVHEVVGVHPGAGGFPALAPITAGMPRTLTGMGGSVSTVNPAFVLETVFGSEPASVTAMESPDARSTPGIGSTQLQVPFVPVPTHGMVQLALAKAGLPVIAAVTCSPGAQVVPPTRVGVTRLKSRVEGKVLRLGGMLLTSTCPAVPTDRPPAASAS